MQCILIDMKTTAADRPALLALFLLDTTGSVFGTWEGRLPAAEQRARFGRVFGKGKIRVDGERERVEYVVRRCFGTDYDLAITPWSALG